MQKLWYTVKRKNTHPETELVADMSTEAVARGNKAAGLCSYWCGACNLHDFNEQPFQLRSLCIGIKKHEIKGYFTRAYDVQRHRATLFCSRV